MPMANKQVQISRQIYQAQTSKFLAHKFLGTKTSQIFLKYKWTHKLLILETFKKQQRKKYVSCEVPHARNPPSVYTVSSCRAKTRLSVKH